MKQARQSLIAVTGNVYYCQFREAPDPDSMQACVVSVAHDIRRAVSGMQLAVREVRATSERLRDTDAHAAAALQELAEAVEEIAFHAHIAAVDCERGSIPLPAAQEMRQLARSGAAAAGDLREWAAQSLGRMQNATRFLMDIAGRVHAAAHALQDKVVHCEDAGLRPH